MIAKTAKEGRKCHHVDGHTRIEVRYICIFREGCIIETLRVSGNSRPNSVAGAIAALLRSEQAVEVQAIGPQAVNQAVKAIAIARSYIELDGLDLTAQPSFVKLELQEEERTAVRFNVRALRLEKPPEK